MFSDNGDGTATLSGTPGAGTGGTYYLTIAASNGVSPASRQNLTLAVDQAPTITSGNSVTLTAGAAGSFSITAAGFPVPTLSESGTLPSGVTFNPATGVLSGSPAAGTGGVYNLTFTAHNGVGNEAVQNLTLTVDEAPAITSANNTTWAVGAASSFTVTATGFPNPTLSESGTLPGGVTFDDNGNGTATLGGTPTAGTGNTYNLTITAVNGVGLGVAQNFTLMVFEAPVITLQPTNQTACGGSIVSFSAAADGFPTPTLQWQYSADEGVTWNDISGATSNTLTVTANPPEFQYAARAVFSNSAGSTATDAATLTVGIAPAITTQPADQSVVAGQEVTFSAAASGLPAPSVQWQVSGDGGATWTNLGDATSASLTFIARPSQNGKFYRAVFTNGCGSATTNGAQLTVAFQPITIRGQAFDDLNGNGRHDPGEPGLPGWTIQLLAPSTSKVLASQTTDQSGDYSFSNLGPGAYRVREVLQPGWVHTTPNPVRIIAESGVNVSAVDFGDVRPADLSIAGASTPNPVIAGSTMTYTLRVVNNGPSPAENVELTDKLPSHVAFQSLTAPAGWSRETPPQGAAGTIICSTPSLENGATATFTLFVTVGANTAPGARLRDTARVTSSTYDPHTTNNRVTIMARVARRPRAGIQPTNNLATVGAMPPGGVEWLEPLRPLVVDGKPFSDRPLRMS